MDAFWTWEGQEDFIDEHGRNQSRSPHICEAQIEREANRKCIRSGGDKEHTHTKDAPSGEGGLYLS